MKNCAIYARSRNLGTGGVVDQILACRAAAEVQGWSVKEQHVFYDNPDEAAIAIEMRPGIQALLKYANERPDEFDTVLVSDVSHLSRKVREILAIYSQLSRVGVDVHVVEVRLKTKRYRPRQQPSDGE